MKQYPSLPALLRSKLGEKSPSPEQITKLQAAIEAEHPGARWLVFFQNGHWILLPAGPGCQITHPREAAKHTVPPRRRAVAYCKI